MIFGKVIKWWYPLAIAVLLAVIALTTQSKSVQTALLQTPVLIIDPGHGGADGGAVADDGTLESQINLAVALRLEALARFWGVDSIMTRTSEDIDYPSDAASIAAKKKADQYARLGIANNTPGAVFLSIHQNKYPAASPFGIQVFFAGTAGSDVLAGQLQDNLTAQLCPNNRRVASPANKDIFLMQNATCTAVLVECGFLSNPNELSALKSEPYQLKLAAVMLASYLQYTRGIET